jgi:hypothetical protein
MIQEEAENVWKKKSATFDDSTYQIEFCIQTDEVILTQPAKSIIGFRNTIPDDYPELAAYHLIGLMPSIAQVMYDKVGLDPKEGDGSDVRMPLVFNDLQHITIGASTYVVGYDVATDLLFIQIPMKIDRLQTCILTTQLFELNVLHNGRLLDEIESFINLHSEKEVDLNREDEF